MRCEACRATNPASATWCNQCYAPLRATASGARTGVATGRPAPGTPQTADGVGRAEPGAASRVSAAPARDRARGAAVSRAAGGRRRSAPGAGAVSGPRSGRRPEVRRRGDGQVEWECPVCASANLLAESACAACGASLAAGFASGREAAPPVAPGVGLALTAVLPGAGHLASGRIGSGIARAFLYAVWLPGGAVLASAPGPGSMAVALPLLLGALLLWAASLLDTAALGGGGRQLAEGRALLWLVVSVLGLTLLGAITATATAGGGLS